MVECLVNSMDDMFIVDRDCEFATAIETAWSKIDGTDNRSSIVCEQQLRMQMNVFHLVDFYAYVLQHSKATDPFHELFLFQRMDGTTQNMDFDSATVSADQVLNDGWILKSLVLQP